MLAPGGGSVSFPGFVDADRRGRAHWDGGPAIDRLDGASRSVLSLVEQPDGGVRAEVCTANSAPQDSDFGPRSEYLFFRREGVSPLTDQHGSRRAPATNPFGGWYAYRSVNSYAHRGVPAEDVPDPRRCESLAPNLSGELSPGWPESGL